VSCGPTIGTLPSNFSSFINLIRCKPQQRSRTSAALLLGLIVLLLSPRRPSQAQPSPPFSLLVTLLFTSEEYKYQFLRDFAPLAAYVRDHEPQTIAYEALQSDQNPLQILLLERYVDKEVAYLQVHKSSKEFLDFRPKLMRMQDAGHVTVSGHSYEDAMLGFVGRNK
jgi:quinol monooxygenase YgiN